MHYTLTCMNLVELVLVGLVKLEGSKAAQRISSHLIHFDKRRLTWLKVSTLPKERTFIHYKAPYQYQMIIQSIDHDRWRFIRNEVGLLVPPPTTYQCHHRWCTAVLYWLISATMLPPPMHQQATSRPPAPQLWQNIPIATPLTVTQHYQTHTLAN